MKKQIVFGLLLGALLASGMPARADSDTMDKVKDDAHSAADSVDSGAHKVKRKVVSKVRHTKTDVKNSNDKNPVRKAARRVDDSGHDAADKVSDTVNGH